jgi:predicted phage gp36 major capsid-like protein
VKIEPDLQRWQSCRAKAGDGLARAPGRGNNLYLLPYFLDPTIVITTDGTTNPYRRIANVKQITTNAYQGVNSAGVQAAFVDEAAAAGTAAYQGVGQIQIGVKKAFAWVYGSFEAAEDTNFADQLPKLIQDGKDILEEQKFAVGTGGTALNSGEPLGIVPSLTNTQRVNAAASGAIAAGDVYNLEAALGPRFRLDSSIGFAANITTSAAGTGTASSGTASAQAVFGAWDNYYIIDRIGMSMLFDPMLKGTGASANVPTGQQGWLAFWRVGAGVSTANAFRWLQYSTG